MERQFRQITQHELRDAEQLFRQRANNIAGKIELHDPATGKPRTPHLNRDRKLPIDEFLEELTKRDRAPKIVFKSKCRKSEGWKKDFLETVYRKCEIAFNEAARFRGGNRAGYREELEAELHNLQRLTIAIEACEPQTINARLLSLFANGIQIDRRKGRITSLMSLDEHLKGAQIASLEVIQKISTDIESLDSPGDRRSPEEQKLAFAKVMFTLWTEIAGSEFVYGSKRDLCRFLESTWKSGLPFPDINSSFSAVLKKII